VLLIVLVFCVEVFGGILVFHGLTHKTKTMSNTDPPKNTTQKTKTMNNTDPTKNNNTENYNDEQR
jgi:hypothetical protein